MACFREEFVENICKVNDKTATEATESLLFEKFILQPILVERSTQYQNCWF